MISILAFLKSLQIKNSFIVSTKSRKMKNLGQISTKVDIKCLQNIPREENFLNT